MTRLEPAPTGHRAEPRPLEPGDPVYLVRAGSTGVVVGHHGDGRVIVKFEGVRGDGLPVRPNDLLVIVGEGGGQ